MAVLLPFPLPAPLIRLREVGAVRGIPVTAHTLEVLVPGAGGAALSHGRHPFAGRSNKTPADDTRRCFAQAQDFYQ